MDGNDIWEALFGIMKGNVPDEMTEEVCEQLASAMTENPPLATPVQDEVIKKRCANPHCPCNATPPPVAASEG